MTEEFVAFDSAIAALAIAFASGTSTVEGCVKRGAVTLGFEHEWLMPLARHYVQTFSDRPRPRRQDVIRVLNAKLLSIVSPRIEINDDDDEFYGFEVVHFDGVPKKVAQYLAAELVRLRATFTVATWLTDSATMQPVAAAGSWKVPRIESTGELSTWLGINESELDWFSGRWSHSRQSPPRTQHYHYKVTPKQSGGFRLIEAPQARLKAMQRQILSEILEHVPNYYSAAHGFVKGRSVKTFAAPHVGKHVVVRMDLRDFFPRIGRARVQAVFRTIGYPEVVANALAGICTNIAPRSLFMPQQNSQSEVRAAFDAKQLYCRPHLPQGAPTSPTLANICAFRMDARLTGLADWAGATYTRYADDIAFSGDKLFARNAERCSTEIAVIAANEGWSVQHRKTRIMRQGVRQHLAGVVVNRTLNVPRRDYDNLKATLVNCIRLGVADQNREGVPNFHSHLAGRVSYIASINPARGKRLRELFARIAW